MANLKISDVLDVMGIPYKSGKPSANIDCPLCDKDSKIHRLHVNFTKDVWRCAKCDSSGGIIHLYGLLKYGFNKNEIDANPKERKRIYSELCNIIGNNNLENRKPVVYERIDVDTASVVKRNEVYSTLLKNLKLTKSHYNDLIKRGLRHSDIVKNGYRSYPTSNNLSAIAKNMRMSGIELQGIPGFYKEKGNWTLVEYSDSYLIPVKNIFKEVQGLQVRFTNPTAKSKYIWLSSSDKQDGASVNTWCHFAGYPEKSVILTEGPLKADIIYRFLNTPTIAIPGVNALGELHDMLKYLKQVGVSKIFTAFDMDFLTNKYVLKAYENLLKILTIEYNFDVEMLKWDENFKGLDDFLLNQFLTYGGKLDPLAK